MDDRTLEALEVSIEKWERNTVAQMLCDVSVSESSCALCRLFISKECKGCPVRESSGYKYCRETPYKKAVNSLLSWRNGVGSRDEFQSAARDEVDFLKSLLPKDKS